MKGIKKYVANNPNKLTESGKKINIFERSKKYKEEIAQKEATLKSLNKTYTEAAQRDLNRQFNEVSEYENDEILKNTGAQIRELTKNLRDLKQNSNNLKKRGIAIILAAGIALSAGITSHVVSEDNFNKNMDAAYNVTQQQDDNSTDKTSYDDLKDKVNAYFESKDQDESKDLHEELKSHLESNPEDFVQLSLDMLKERIAESIGIDDYTRITIIDSSTSKRADKYNDYLDDGHLSKLSILLENPEDGSLTEIGVHESFFYEASGETNIKESNIPEGVRECINLVVAGQSADSKHDKAKAAGKAMKAIRQLSPEDLTFEFSDEEKIQDNDDER